MKERLGQPRKCSGCGKPGRERLRDPPDGLSPTHWACSAQCADQVLRARKPEDRCVLGWVKLG